jgi:spoIIIJ-associated protein
MNTTLIQKKIEDVLSGSGFVYSTLEWKEEFGILWCSLSSSDAHVLLAREAEGLRALTYLVKRIVETEENREHVSRLCIDINDFYKKHVHDVESTAHMFAERAKYFKSTLELPPMNAFDRRIVHTYLESDPELETQSVGEAHERRVVIVYKAN